PWRTRRPHWTHFRSRSRRNQTTRRSHGSRKSTMNRSAPTRSSPTSASGDRLGVIATAVEDLRSVAGLGIALQVRARARADSAAGEVLGEGNPAEDLRAHADREAVGVAAGEGSRATATV